MWHSQLVEQQCSTGVSFDNVQEDAAIKKEEIIGLEKLMWGKEGFAYIKNLDKRPCKDTGYV